jgi:Flp pilus assembly protein TadG
MTIQTPPRSITCRAFNQGSQVIKHHQGSVIVEFALVLPIFLLLFFGIVSYGTALFDKLIITNASREAVRAGVVYKTPRLTGDEITAVALAYCANHLVTYGEGTTLTVVPTYPDGGQDSGDRLTVTVTYGNYSGLYSLLIGQNIVAESTMKYE